MAVSGFSVSQQRSRRDRLSKYPKRLARELEEEFPGLWRLGHECPGVPVAAAQGQLVAFAQVHRGLELHRNSIGAGGIGEVYMLDAYDTDRRAARH